MKGKAAYVVGEARKGPAGNHHCHWPGCERKVPPAFWGCRKHWAMLPRHLQARIWATYKSGQEVTKTPSRDYVEAAKAVQEWIANRPIDAAVPAEAWEGLKARLIGDPFGTGLHEPRLVQPKLL